LAIFKLLLGIALLLRGRKLFWLLLGCVGFILGFDFAQMAIHNQPQNVILIIALSAGVLGAMIAIFLQKFAVVAGGFFVGGYLFVELLKVLGMSTGHSHWILFIAGGLVGAVLMSVVFRWALVILSSFIGAILILQSFHFGHELTRFLFVCLALLGISIQFGLIRKEPSR
jgi:hypothetical protein